VSASALLDEVIAGHGGASLYDSTPRSRPRLGCGGWAFPLRFNRGALADMTATASTHEPRTVIRGNGRPLRKVAVVSLAFHDVTLRPRTDAAVPADATGSAEARPASGSA
jgi:hypothetical protein